MDIPGPRLFEIFWAEMFNRISEHDASDFLQALTQAENVCRYDVQQALASFPDSWRCKISVKRIWNSVLSDIAQRFAPELTDYYSLKYFLGQIRSEDDALPSIQQGIIKGLSNSCELVDAGTLFGFANIVSSFISPSEAVDLFEYALARFEDHIDDEFADGPWADWLVPPEEVSDAFTGFVWAALGSPSSAMRWQAAHCVRRLAEVGCQYEINALIEWMRRDVVGPFGSSRFPFYNFHARQYLLISMARVALDYPEILEPHLAFFVQQALGNVPHVLHQKNAAEIALSIESSFPSSCASEVIEQLKIVGVSNLPIRKGAYGDQQETPWHINGEVDQSLDFHFDFEFNRYWFNSLGDVFGVSVKQVEELAREVVVQEWRIDIDDQFIQDPRKNLYRYHHTKETWHSHSSYPKTDDYSFYLSYHAMLAVAAKLVQSVPVLHRNDWSDDEWTDWLHQHNLTRFDGRWLADRRDPLPLERRSWIGREKSEDWRWDIAPKDLLEGLLWDRGDETWLHISGYWSDNDSGFKEKYDISSALVAPATSQSLLNALFFCHDPWNCYLPVPDDNDEEIESSLYELKNLVYSGSSDKRLDKFDLQGGDIEYPPFNVNQFIMEEFDLAVDIEQRTWHLPDMVDPSLVCELWGEHQSEERGSVVRYGKRISASMDFLKQLCTSTGCEIIFQVKLERQQDNLYSQGDDVGYQPPYSKIFILSADGILRDEKENCRLR